MELQTQLSLSMGLCRMAASDSALILAQLLQIKFSQPLKKEMAFIRDKSYWFTGKLDSFFPMPQHKSQFCRLNKALLAICETHGRLKDCPGVIQDKIWFMEHLALLRFSALRGGEREWESLASVLSQEILIVLTDTKTCFFPPSSQCQQI